MPSIHDQLSEQFHKWEKRGRGWQVFDEPVAIEPPFVPFEFRNPFSDTPPTDTGARPNFLGSLVRGMGKKLAPEPPSQPEPEQEDEEAEPTPLIREPLTELQVLLPLELHIAKDSLEQFFSSLSLCKEPIAFEIFGAPKRVIIQFAAAPYDVPLLRRQLQAYFPMAQFKKCQDTLAQTWATCSGKGELVAEFGLAREFMYLLANGKLDPFVGIAGTLSELQSDELGLFQVLWQPVREDWPENIMRSVTDRQGNPLFVNRPELTNAAESKISKPLFAAVARIAAKAATYEQAVQIACDMAGALRTFTSPQGNHLIPLDNEIETYSLTDHVTDMLFRQSRRSGMILNSDELAGFVHLPSNEVQSPVLVRDAGQTKAAPDIVRNTQGLFLGNNVHFDESIPVVLTPEQRVYHTHIIGTTGTGKSTLLFNLIRQDIENGQGVAVLDPHGDLIDRILGVIPKERIDDVVLVDLEDEDFPVGFNILHAHSSHERKLLASDLVSLFRRLSTSWGDQMDAVLHNAILAFLYNSRGGTLADLRRFLVEEKFRKEFLETVSDPNVLYYWQKGFLTLGGNKSIGSVITRLNDFLAEPPIFNMVAQPANRLNFEEIMDSGKIFLAKPPEGVVGKENSYLLGAVLVSKFQQLVMARQRQKIETRRDFWIYIDEFANFITPSMADILSGARKYRIGLTLAHHELHQLQRSPEVASAVMAHPNIRMVFRVSDDDAKKLADGFSLFKADRLKNLGKGQAICRVERSEFDFNLSIELPQLPDEKLMERRKLEVIEASRRKYTMPRAQVEAEARKAFDPGKSQTAVDRLRPPPEEAPAPPKQAVVPKSPSSVPQVSEMPNVSEVQKETVSAQDIAEAKREHEVIKTKIQIEAEELDYTVVPEEFVEGGKKRIDLTLRRGNRSIACEVSVMTQTEFEATNNIPKCLDGKFSHIAVVSKKPKKLARIQQLFLETATPDEAAKVGFYSPDEFISKLNEWAMEDPDGGAVEREKPRKQPIVFDEEPITLEEQQQREAYLLAALKQALKPKTAGS
jgi:hypothetical protein